MREKEFDIVIIGSGAGGGVAARELSELCKNGVRIAVLEWGPRLGDDEFSGKELEMADRLMFDGGGMLTRDRSVTMAVGRAFGGATVVYTGTSFIMAEETLKEWDIPSLTYSDLKRRSEKYWEEDNVHYIEDDLINDNNRLFKKACEKLGYGVGRFPINVKGCQGAGICNLGCPNRAKQGTDVVQLLQAEKNGVLMVSNCKVERIEEKCVVATVFDPGYGDPSPWEPGPYRIKAKVVVACGGAVQSPALLQRSKFQSDLPALGRYFVCHPALILAGQHEKSITNYYGHPKTYFSEHFAASHGFVLETCMYFPLTTAKSLVGFGEKHALMMSRMDRLQMIIALAFDEPEKRNRIRIDRQGDAVLDYRVSDRTLDSLFTAQKVCADILFAAGAKQIHAPAAKKFIIEADERHDMDSLLSRKLMKRGRLSLASAHPMGGCRMGASPSDSVTDSWGAVHGIPWLFAADASLFPRCARINPYITVMALADRVAERITKNIRELLNA